MSDVDKAMLERDYLGVAIRHNPLLKYREKAAACTTASIAELSLLAPGTPVVIHGEVQRFEPRQTQRGEDWLQFYLADLSGAVRVLVFPGNMAKCVEAALPGTVIVVEGKVRREVPTNDDALVTPRVEVEAIRAVPLAEARPVSERKRKATMEGKERWQRTCSLKAAVNDHARRVHVEFDAEVFDEGMLETLRDLLLRYPGRQPVVLHFVSPTGRKRSIGLSKRYRVAWVDELVIQLNKLPGVLQTWEEREVFGSEQQVPAAKA